VKGQPFLNITFYLADQRKPHILASEGEKKKKKGKKILGCRIEILLKKDGGKIPLKGMRHQNRTDRSDLDGKKKSAKRKETAKIDLA